MQIESLPQQLNQIPAPEQVVLTDEKGQQRVGHEYTEPGQTIAVGDQMRASEPDSEDSKRATHVFIETDDGQQLLIRQNSEDRYDIASTRLASKENPRRDIDSSLLAGVTAKVGEPLVLGSDPQTGRQLRTKGAITRVTTLNMLEAPLEEDNVLRVNGDTQRDSVQSFGSAMRAAQQGNQENGEVVATQEAIEAVTHLGRNVIDLEQFRDNPVEALTQDRKDLFTIGQDESLSQTERQTKLSEALDAYFDKIIALDSLIEDTGDTAKSGIPEYVPDGFMELGTLDSLKPSERYNREINYVDKRAMLARYKDVFTKVYSRNPNGIPQEKIDMTIAHKVAEAVYFGIPYARDDSYKPAERGGVLKMSELQSGICQQQALTSQVLLQAFGIEARLSKNSVAGADEIARVGAEKAYGGDHVSNFMKIGDKWYVFDATNHNSPPSENARKFVPGIFELSEAPDPARKQEFVLDTNLGPRKYTTRQNMYWAKKLLPAAA